MDDPPRWFERVQAGVGDSREYPGFYFEHLEACGEHWSHRGPAPRPTAETAEEIDTWWSGLEAQRREAMLEDKEVQSDLSLDTLEAEAAAEVAAANAEEEAAENNLAAEELAAAVATAARKKAEIMTAEKAAAAEVAAAETARKAEEARKAADALTAEIPTHIYRRRYFGLYGPYVPVVNPAWKTANNGQTPPPPPNIPADPALGTARGGPVNRTRGTSWGAIALAIIAIVALVIAYSNHAWPFDNNTASTGEEQPSTGDVTKTFVIINGQKVSDGGTFTKDGHTYLVNNVNPADGTYSTPVDITTIGGSAGSSCMRIEDAQAIFEQFKNESLDRRINDAIVAFNAYTALNPGVRVYSDTNSDYRAWRDGQLPQEATVIVWTDLAGTLPEVLTPADNLSDHTLATDFLAVTSYIKVGWGFFVAYGPVMMQSPFGGALMCGQFDGFNGTQPINTGSASVPQSAAAVTTQQTDIVVSSSACMPVKTAHNLFQANGSIDNAINAFNAWVKNHKSAGIYGDAGAIAWPKDLSVLKPEASVIVWTDLLGNAPKVRTSGHTLDSDFLGVNNFVEGTRGLFVAYGPVKMPTGFGAVILCGQFDGTKPVNFSTASVVQTFALRSEANAAVQPATSQCMTASTAKKLVFSSSTIASAISKLDRWVKNHQPNGGYNGQPGTVASKHSLVWTDLRHKPANLTPVRVEGTYGVFKTPKNKGAKVPTGFGLAHLCG